MSDDKFSVSEIVTKLIGPIVPVGCSTRDRDRLKNLKAMTELVDALVYDINYVTSFKDSYESSVKEAGQFAQKFLTDLKETL